MFIRTLAASLLTIFLVIIASLAPVRHVKGAAHGAIPTIPTYANANNHVAFFEQFNSTSNIDLAQSVPAGKNWYTTNQAANQGGTCASGFTAATPSWYTASNGAVTIASNSATCQGFETMSVGWVGTGVTHQNFTIPGSGGFYIEGVLKWTPNCSSQSFIPDFWMQDLTGTVAQLQGTTVGRFGELDIMEDCCNASCGTGGNGIVQTILDWTNWNTNSGFSRSNAVGLNGLDSTKFHQWGALLTTMAQGGGTGSVKWYLDRVQTGSAVTWTSTGAFGASLETSNFEINFAAGVAIPLSLNSIVVFTP